MASRTKITESKRKAKNRKGGLDRKKKSARDGSTPKFPIHPEKTN